MMRRSIRLGMSKEEKIALSIGRLLSDFTLDLEAIGKYLAVSNPHLIYARALEVLESAEYNKTVAEYREIGKYYSDRLF
jgi:hypothetical protein